MSDGPQEQLKRFVFSSKYNLRGEPQEEKLEVIIPEVHRPLAKSSSRLCIFAATSTQLLVLHVALRPRACVVFMGAPARVGR